MSLGPADVHVWVARTTGLDDAGRAARLALLDEGERARHARFRFERNRDEFLVAHALVRTALSRHDPRPPAAWRFEVGSHGRPEPLDAGDLRFNLTHTDGLAAVAITRGRDVGVDAERVAREVEPELAERHFAPAELAALRGLTGPAWRARFFDLWTLKESYIKGRGLGLALDLRRFAFRLAPPAPPEVDIDPALEDRGDAWTFWLLDAGPEHRVAVAARHHGQALRLERLDAPG